MRWGFKGKSADVEEGLYLAFWALAFVPPEPYREPRTTNNGSICWISKDGKKKQPPTDDTSILVCLIDSKC